MTTRETRIGPGVCAGRESGGAVIRVCSTQTGARPSIGKMNTIDAGAVTGKTENTWRFALELTDEQLAVFGPAAQQNRSKVGELVLALACVQLEANPTSGGIDSGLFDAHRALWSFATGRMLPSVHEKWESAGFPVVKGGAS